MNDFKNKINIPKDFIISKILRLVANYYLNDYGKIVDFKANSERKEIYLNILLKGDIQNIDLFVINYKITTNEHHSSILFDDLNTSKEWLNILINNYVQKDIEIPKSIGTLLNKIL